MEAEPQPQPQIMGVQPQYVMMPVRQSNGLGIFGLILAFFGLFVPTGLLAFLGLGVSLVAIGKSPRVAATFGVLIGLLGTIIWLAIDLVAIIAVVLGLAGAAAGTAVAFAITQPETVEMTSDMINIAIATQHRIDKGEHPPTTIAELGLPMPMTIDPWGNPYRFALTDRDPGFDIVCAGTDESFDTDDDVALTGLDVYWQQSIASFENRMEHFGEMMASMQNSGETFRIDMGDMKFTVGRGNVSIHGTSDAGLPVNINLPDGDDSPTTGETMRAFTESYWNTAAREVDSEEKSVEKREQREEHDAGHNND